MNLDKFEKGPREIFHPEIQKVTENFVLRNCINLATALELADHR